MSEQDKTTMSAEEVLQKFDKESDKLDLSAVSWQEKLVQICNASA